MRNWTADDGRALMLWRGQQRLTQDDLAAAVGVTKQAVSLWEQGRAPSAAKRKVLQNLMQPRREQREATSAMRWTVNTIPLDSGENATLRIPHPITRADVERIREWLALMEAALTEPVEECGDRA